MPYAAIRIDNSEDPRRLIYDIVGPSVSLTESQMRLRAELSKLQSIIVSVFEEREVRIRLFGQLREVAERTLTVGAVSENASAAELSDLSNAIVSEGQKVRSQRISRIFRSSLLLLGTAILLFLLYAGSTFYSRSILNRYEQISTETLQFAEKFIGGIAFGFVGLFVGINFNVLLVNRNITLKTLSHINIYRFSAPLYCFYMAIILIVFALLLVSQLVQVGIGGVHLNQLIDHKWIGVFIGLLCAIAEPRVADLVAEVMKPEVRKSDEI